MDNYYLSNWDDVRVFLKIARTGSFASASDALGMSQSTISRRVFQLEDRLGARLFDRGKKGSRLTPVGRVICDAAESMESAATDIERGVAGIDHEMRGTVVITATEGIGAYWLTPRIFEFQRRHPGLSIQVDTTPDTRDLANLEADISLRFNRPKEPDLIVRRVAKVQFRPFAANSYLWEYGTPEGIQDLKEHNIVDYYPSPRGEIWDAWNEATEDCRNVTFRSSASSAVGFAVEAGFGIGLLPIYSVDHLSEVQDLPIPIGPPLEVWVASHMERNRSRRVRATLDFIYHLFAKDRFRYFSG